MKLIREPLFHFAALGLVAADAWMNGRRGESTTFVDR